MRPKLTLGATMLLAAMSAIAHHSNSMFDSQTSVTLSGTVKEFQFTNPHCFIQLVAPNLNGDATEWSIEMGAPAHLLRAGWKPRTLKPGDKLTVVIHPLKDGGRGGNYVSAKRADGTLVGELP
jgi:Family of unknown function (DUF6152)